LGATVLIDATPRWIDTRIGDTMVDFTSSKQQPTRIDHFAVGVDPWIGAERALEMLQKRFPAARARIVENPVAGPGSGQGPWTKRQGAQGC